MVLPVDVVTVRVLGDREVTASFRKNWKRSGSCDVYQSAFKDVDERYDDLLGREAYLGSDRDSQHFDAGSSL